MKLLIELPTWLGDCVMATPAIENIVNFNNDVEITFIGSFIAIEALKNHPKVVKTVVLDKKYRVLYKIARNLGEFDYFFSFRSSLRTKFLKFLISAKNKYQFDKNKYQHRHQVEKYNDFINDSLDINFPAGKLLLSTISSQSSTQKTVGINPGASYGSAKRWYPEEFAKVASELSDRYDIVIFGGPGEVDIALDIEKLLIKKDVKNYKNLAGKTTIPELINHISNLDLFITGDSGPMHVAATFEVPTVAIFGPTKDDETSQWMNEKSLIVKKNLDCQPCMKRTCPLGHHDCMNLIKAVDVLDSVKSL
jgi:heptosyltransferase-2